MMHLLLCCISIALAKLDYIYVDPLNNRFVDQNGTTHVFHGVNAVYKLPPFYPITSHFDPQKSLCDEDIDNLVSWVNIELYKFIFQ